MKNALYVLRYAKGTSRAKAMSNSEPVALAVIKLRLFEGISQSVSQAVSRNSVE